MSTHTIPAHEATEGMIEPNHGRITTILQVTYLGAPAFRITFEDGYRSTYLPSDDIEVIDGPQGDDLIVVHDNTSGKLVNFAKYVRGAQHVVTVDSVRGILTAMDASYPGRYTVRRVDTPLFSPEVITGTTED